MKKQKIEIDWKIISQFSIIRFWPFYRAVSPKGLRILLISTIA